MKTKLFFFAIMAGLCLMAGCSKENKNNDVVPKEDDGNNEIREVFDLAMSSIGKRVSDVNSLLAAANYEFEGDTDDGLNYVKQDGKVRIYLVLWHGSDGVIFSSGVNLSSESSYSYIGDDDKFVQFVYSLGEKPSLPSGDKAGFADFWFVTDNGNVYEGESWSELKSCFAEIGNAYVEAEMSWRSDKDSEDCAQEIFIERESEPDEEEIDIQIIDLTFYKE